MSELYAPLADRMRPASLDNFYGQEKLVGKGRMLRQLLEGDSLPSLILWGPPGSGKTTLLNILSGEFNVNDGQYRCPLGHFVVLRQGQHIYGTGFQEPA